MEVLYNGVWGGVCATGWNDDAGRLVCAQLGYDSNNDYFGLGFAGRYVVKHFIHINVLLSQSRLTLFCVDILLTLYKP